MTFWKKRNGDGRFSRRREGSDQGRLLSLQNLTKSPSKSKECNNCETYSQGNTTASTAVTRSSSSSPLSSPRRRLQKAPQQQPVHGWFQAAVNKVKSRSPRRRKPKTSFASNISQNDRLRSTPPPKNSVNIKRRVDVISSPLNTTVDDSIKTGSPQSHLSSISSPNPALEVQQRLQDNDGDDIGNNEETIVFYSSTDVDANKTTESDNLSAEFNAIVTRVRPPSEISWEIISNMPSSSTTNQCDERTINPSYEAVFKHNSESSKERDGARSPVIANMDALKQHYAPPIIDCRVVDKVNSQEQYDGEKTKTETINSGEGESRPPRRGKMTRKQALARDGTDTTCGDSFDEFVQKVTKNRQWSPQVTKKIPKVAATPDRTSTKEEVEEDTPSVIESPVVPQRVAVPRRYVLVRNPNEVTPKKTRKSKRTRIGTPGPRSNELVSPHQQQEFNATTPRKNNVSHTASARKSLNLTSLKQRRLQLSQTDGKASVSIGKKNAYILNTDQDNFEVTINPLTSAFCQQKSPNAIRSVSFGYIQGNDSNMEVFLDNIALSNPNTRYKIINGMCVCSHMVQSLKICFTEMDEVARPHMGELHDVLETIRFRLPNLQRLYLSGFVSIDLEYCMASLCDSNTILQVHLCLANGMLTRETVQALSKFESLSELIVDVDQSFSLAPILASRSLKTLRIGCFDDKSAEAVPFQFSDTEMQKFAYKIEELNKQAEDGGTVSLSLATLDIKPRMSSEALQALLSALRRNRTVKSLAYAFCGNIKIANAIASEITFMLGYNSTIKSMRNYEYNKVTITNEDLLLKGLMETNSTVQEFKLFKESFSFSCQKNVLLARNSIMTVADNKNGVSISEKFGCGALPDSSIRQEECVSPSDDSGEADRSTPIGSVSVSSLVKYFNHVVSATDSTRQR